MLQAAERVGEKMAANVAVQKASEAPLQRVGQEGDCCGRPEVRHTCSGMKCERPCGCPEDG
jgi:hypothetical protein